MNERIRKMTILVSALIFVLLIVITVYRSHIKNVFLSDARLSTSSPESRYQLSSIKKTLAGTWESISDPVEGESYVFNLDGRVDVLLSDDTKETGSYSVVHTLGNTDVVIKKAPSGQPIFSEDNIKEYNNNYLKLKFKDRTEYYGIKLSNNETTLEMANLKEGSIIWYSRH